ncbi:MAG: hypothetical protein OHK93_007989 [Ramalina farinacea]|uniref:Uncharacterized protein n=1 Tax=Ramalina farinacea TaxID=258253 RepID=A0AA43QLK7_9LECA|nr:hypothetical protein [Ramalina farinacea]
MSPINSTADSDMTGETLQAGRETLQLHPGQTRRPSIVDENDTTPLVSRRPSIQESPWSSIPEPAGLPMIFARTLSRHAHRTCSGTQGPNIPTAANDEADSTKALDQIRQSLLRLRGRVSSGFKGVRRRVTSLQSSRRNSGEQTEPLLPPQPQAEEPSFSGLSAPDAQGREHWPSLDPSQWVLPPVGTAATIQPVRSTIRRSRPATTESSILGQTMITAVSTDEQDTSSYRARA